jgi:hypothetical protein
MALTTTVGGVWVLQALLGVESMPAGLRLKPFIPSVHHERIVDSTAGPVAIAETAEYLSLLQAGAISPAGGVDDPVRDWMTVLGRPDREVVLTIRRPSGLAVHNGEPPTVDERVVVVCRHRRWLAMAARDGDEMVIDAVGETDDPAAQVDLMCQTLIPALGVAEPADVEGVNIPAEVMQSVLEAAAPHGRDAVIAAVSRLGLHPQQAEVLAAATRLDESAMAVAVVIDHGIGQHVHPRVVTVADTEFGRISVTTSASADGKQWLSIWPATPAAVREDLAELLSLPRAAA